MQLEKLSETSKIDIIGGSIEELLLFTRKVRHILHYGKIGKTIFSNGLNTSKDVNTNTVCVNHLFGDCHHGDNCKFVHSFRESTNLPENWKTLAARIAKRKGVTVDKYPKRLQIAALSIDFQHEENFQTESARYLSPRRVDRG